MKKMIYDIPLATLGIYMNAQPVKVGFYNLFADAFEKDLPVFEGSMGDLMHNQANREMWNNMKMRKVNHMAAENGVVVIGVDRYDAE